MSEPLADDRDSEGAGELGGQGHKVLRNAVSLGLLLVAIAYMAYALRGQSADIVRAMRALPAATYPTLLGLTVVTLVPAIVYHPIAVKRLWAGSVAGVLLAHAYASAQIARYLPGKIFGLMLESSILHRRVPAGAILAANLVQMLMIYAWSTALGTSIIWAWHAGSALPLILIPAALAVLWWAHHAAWAERTVPHISRRLRPRATVVASVPVHANATGATALIAVQWLPFIVLWHLLAGASAGWNGAAVLASCYLLSSIFGSLLLVVPSGVVVREAAFVSLGLFCGFDAAELLSWSLIVRMLLTAGDLLCALLFWALAKTAHD